MQPDTDDREMVLADNRCAVDRYRGYRVLPGEVLEVFFDEPRQVIRVEGQDNVDLALEEIRDALEVPDRPGMWTTI